MMELDSAPAHEAHAGKALIIESKSPPTLRRSVFSRFCKCGANVTLGLVSDDGYRAAEAVWDAQHRGSGHEVISHQEWLAEKLKQAC